MSDYEAILKSYQDPYLQEDYISLNAIESLNIEGKQAKLTLSLPYPCRSVEKKINQQLSDLLAEQGLKLQLNIKQKIPPFNPRPQTAQLAQVRNIIAIASGKGGVGKSTVALNIARALQWHGAKVGLLDADIYGPSQPHLLKQQPKENLSRGKQLMTVVVDGLQTMSLSYLLANKVAPTIWRGAMASNAIQQLLNTTTWEDLDYLVIDLPPGTGDIQLTLCQRASLSGTVIVSTPHALALLGAAKGVEMFQRLYVPILGMVENMSFYPCPSCSTRQYPFGKKGTEILANKMKVPLLAEIPLTPDCHRDLDQQQHGEIWQQLALDIALAVSQMKVAIPPSVQVAND